jgi:RNA polymerase sigma factor (sigma-70 family)
MTPKPLFAKDGTGNCKVPLKKSDANTALAGLAATHGDQLRRFLLPRVRIKEDVPDILQEVYLRMLRVPRWESIRSPEAYVFTVARHVLQQHLLRQSALPSSIDLTRLLEQPPEAPEADPMLAAVAQQCVEKLQRSLDRLSPTVRAAFMLHRRDGLSFDEIAQQLNISRAMAKKHILTALVQLRAKLARKD